MANSCIRCGYCVPVCPKGLLPQELLWFSRKQDAKALRRLDLQACIECERCNRSCPSHIDLVTEFQNSKREITAVADRQIAADQAKQRTQRHNSRQEKLAAAKAAQRTARLSRIASISSSDSANS